MTTNSKTFVPVWVRDCWLCALEYGDFSGLEEEEVAELEEATKGAEADGLYYLCPMTEADYYMWDHGEEAPEEYSREEWKTHELKSPDYVSGALPGDCVCCFFERR